MSFDGVHQVLGMQVDAGRIYDDRWITPKLSLTFHDLPRTPVFCISLWNPDTSARFHNNALTVTCSDTVQTVRNIRMGQVLDIVVDLSGIDAPGLDVSISNSLAPNPDDRRHRAMTIVGMRWTDRMLA